jgi:hypothetical protein
MKLMIRYRARPHDPFFGLLLALPACAGLAADSAATRRSGSSRPKRGQIRCAQATGLASDGRHPYCSR